MANKKAKQSGTGLVAQAKVVREVAFGLGDDLVGLALQNAKTSQEILQKVIKGGITIFGMQQKLTLDTLDKVVSNEQFQKMVQLPVGYFNRFKNVAETTVENAVEDVKEAVEDAKETVVATAEKVNNKVQKVLTDQDDDLTKIKGIGPKAAEVLAEAGYTTFASLADANIKELKAILEKAGGRYAKIDPSNWIEQSIFAATGDWTSLKNWNKTK